MNYGVNAEHKRRIEQMALYESNKIRNICLMGHGGDGKTSLAEAMLFLSKATDRLGKTSDGNTVCDFDAEEKKRTISISTALANIEWNGCKINILDIPGFFDFAGEALQAVRVADSAIIVIDGKSGCKVGTEISYEYAEKIPKAFFINKLDDSNAQFDNTLEGLHSVFGTKVCPVFIPIDGGYYSLIKDEAYSFDEKGNKTKMPTPASSSEKIAHYHTMLTEALAETSDGLMEKFFAEEPFTHEETISALNRGLIDGTIVPVFSGSATALTGVRELLDTVAASFCSPVDKKYDNIENQDGGTEPIEMKPDGDASVFVFKTVADPFVGKMSYFKVMNGKLKKDSILTNVVSGQVEKIAKLCTMRGSKQTDVDELVCGDIGVTAKLINTNTNDTLTSGSSKARYLTIKFPKPYLVMAIVPTAKGDEDKISGGITKLLEEDYTIRYEVNKETKQMCLYGLGDMHLDIITSKLKTRFGVSVTLVPAKVPYRETITKSAQVEGKHKKQSGGHGQYGHVRIEFSPGTQEGLEFTETVFGGSVPKNFFPAVEKGLQESLQKGTLAGYPVINVKANLYDGSYHPVDSSEMSFKIAANLAFKEGMKQCGTVLLEPIGSLKVLVPDSMMGDIIGDLNKRRGRILGTDQSEKKGFSVVEADVPQAEMGTYAIQLRAMTQGRGVFTYQFERYEEAPANVAQKVIEEAKKAAENE